MLLGLANILKEVKAFIPNEFTRNIGVDVPPNTYFLEIESNNNSSIDRKSGVTDLHNRNSSYQSIDDN